MESLLLPCVDTHCNIPDILKAMKADHSDTWESVSSFFPTNPKFSLESVVSVASDAASHSRNLEISSTIPNIYGAFGIHPLYAYEYTTEMEAQKVAAMSSPKTVAWGEIGLDYHDFGPKFNYAKPDLQKTIFVSQIHHAIEAKKPIIIHTREAEEDTFQIMKEHIPADWKLWIGFTGVVTFKNSGVLRSVVDTVPADRLLFETDGPFMSPEPFRGKTCHPGYLPLIGQKMAQIKKMPEAELFAIVRENTRSMYGV